MGSGQLDVRSDIKLYARKDNARLKFNSGSGDIYTWRCSKCDATVSMRRNSFLEEFKIPVKIVVKLIHAFAFEENIDDTCLNLGISKPTAIKFFRRLREIICFECDMQNMKLGGLGEVVEIDESKFMKVKHGRGKDLKRKLVSILPSFVLYFLKKFYIIVVGVWSN